MGRSVTPTYRVEVRANVNMGTTYTWDGKIHGRANEANLEKWRKALNASFQPKGVNWHVSDSLGVVPHICRATLIRQRTGEVVAEVTAPMFEVA